MPPTLTDPPGPHPYRWPVAEYYKLAALDLFRRERVMLLDGVIHVSPLPDSPAHGCALGLVGEWCWRVFREEVAGWHTRQHSGFTIGEWNDPTPDLSVVPGVIRDHSKSFPTRAALVVEVADTSLLLDTTTKAELYATAEVPDYWVLDLNNRQLIVFRDPQPDASTPRGFAYRTRQTLDPVDTISPLAAPAAVLTVADLRADAVQLGVAPQVQAAAADGGGGLVHPR